MARTMAEWHPKRGPIAKIMPSDVCKGDTARLALGLWYDFHEVECHLGNVGLTGVKGCVMADTGQKTRSAELIQYWKSRIIFLSIGLVLGPIVSGWIGWHVTTGTMNSAVQDAVVAYRAELCAKRAQADPEATSDVLENWTSRRELAEKWAVLPGEEKADRDVISQCSSRLAPI